MANEIADLVMLVKILARKVISYDRENAQAWKALDYLSRKKLVSSSDALRELDCMFTGAQTEQQAQQTNPPGPFTEATNTTQFNRKELYRLVHWFNSMKGRTPHELTTEQDRALMQRIVKFLDR